MKLTYRNGGKRCMDIAITAAALPAAITLSAIAAIAIKVDDGGPVIYRSSRLGRGMEPFTMYKLRTMRVNAPDIRNADGSTYSAEDDPRVTRVGRLLRKTSVDELPQLINVLKGDMSLVGPRPSPLGNEATYDDLFRRRFEVRPGVTGYSQAYQRNSDTIAERGRRDAHYVDSMSWLLDLRIIARTITRVASSSDLNRQVVGEPIGSSGP